ncbi:MAG TPA: response regulator [Rhizomicrobium sp.]|nr:response regulator [Rhizomicrobium sp.]
MVKHDAVNVLLVDDQPGKLLSYEVMLEELGENLVSVSSANEALAYLLKSDVAVILVDVCMPELDGFELAKLIREHPRFQKTAIIFISAIHMSETDYLRGYEAGAVDYLSVPVVAELLRAKVRIFAELYRKTRDLRQLNEELERRVAERTEALEASAERLRESEEARSLALASGQMGSWGWEVEGDKWFWDEGQSRIFGVPQEGFVPSMGKMRKCIHPDDLPTFMGAIASLDWNTPSFDIELRIVRPDGDLRWCRLVTAAQLGSNGDLVRLSGVTADITERKEADAKQSLLAREVDHRAKNALAVVQAIVRLARRDDIQEFILGVEGRINALAQTHELLSRSRWEGADVSRLVLDELAPYQGEKPQRVAAIGPTVMVSPENAQAVAIALHELATNAAKYGALSQPDGRVDVSWSSFEGKLALTWKETGGPKVEPPSTQGFGTKIISASFADPRRGNVAFDWRPDGLICSLELNLMAPQPAAATMHALDESSGHQRRLLLVEDEVLVGLFMGEMLEDMHFTVTEPCRTVADGMAAAKNETFDGAVLDMNLNGESVYPLADFLASQNVPFVFVTGYSAEVVADRFAQIPIIQKPVAADTLAKILHRHLGQSPTAGAPHTESADNLFAYAAR